MEQVSVTHAVTPPHRRRSAELAQSADCLCQHDTARAPASRRYWQQSELPIGVGPDDFPETLFHEWHARAKDIGALARALHAHVAAAGPP